MVNSPSAERIGNILRARGFPVATVGQYRQILSLLDESQVRQLSSHLTSIAAAVDDKPSIAWVGALTRLAQGRDPAHEAFDHLVGMLHERGSPQPAAIKGATKQSQAQRARERQTVHVYASSGALCFELDKLRPDGAGREQLTVSIDAAPSVGRQQFDWSNKMTVQLGVRELPMLVGVLMGAVPEWSAKSHGVDHNKSLRLRAQSNGFQVFVTHASAAVSVPMLYQDTYPVLSLSLKALQANDPHLTTETILQLCARASGVHARR